MVMDFIDHFRMINKLKSYYPEVRLNATKYNTFETEHIYYSKLEQEIKKGYSTELIYDASVIHEIEKPIEIIELKELPIMYFPNIKDRIEYDKLYNNHPVSTIQRIFEPKLLRSGQDYSEEGSYMSHCVGGYVDSESSIIISLRIGEERVTCEYNTRDKRCVQARYFRNQNPPSYFEEAIKKLNDRIRRMPESISPLERKKIPIIINGVKVVPEAPIVFVGLDEAIF
jgi:5'-3' exonuclease